MEIYLGAVFGAVPNIFRKLDLTFKERLDEPP